MLISVCDDPEYLVLPGCFYPGEEVHVNRLFLRSMKLKKCSFPVKILFLVFIPLTFSFQGSSQSGAFSEKDVLLNVGLGLNSPYGGGIPWGGSLEFGVSDEFRVGGILDYYNFRYRYSSNYYKYRVTYLGFRGSFHFNQLFHIRSEKADVYGGLALGYRSFTWTDDFIGTVPPRIYSSNLYLGVHFGGKYYFNDRIGGFLEIGDLGSSNGRFGLCFRL
jgi:hypothetical protein